MLNECTKTCDVESRNHLAVHAVSHAAMTRNGVAKVLNLKPPLEARSKEAAEGRYDGRKHCQHHCVQLHGHMQSHINRSGQLSSLSVTAKLLSYSH